MHQSFELAAKGSIHYAVDFKKRLQEDETLTGEPEVDVVAASAGTTDDLQISNVQLVDGTKIGFTASGGTALDRVSPSSWRTTYCLRLKCATTDNETEAWDLDLIVHSCVEVGA